MEKRWIYYDPPGKKAIKKLAEAINVSHPLATVLIQRGIKEYEEARAYFRPEIQNLHDPFLMADMDKAAKRLHEAIRNQERILVYGDYDVDGTTAVALMYNFLIRHVAGVMYYINDRETEGYGISDQGIDFAGDNEVDLIISVDCGIKASSSVDRATEKGIDFIICDHH
ncbi:MAG: DHH family phosphoesterase, partial [Cyclobacteriaceae bacterium]|nr:DHH family phosphoesterase [Cyclobacteriaceae bacterium]